MLSARAYSFRQKSRLAISLSWIGGYTNVVALLSVGTFTSHMTGTTSLFGLAVSGGKYSDAYYFGFLLQCFFGGAVISTVMTESARRRGNPSKYILPIATEALLLTILAALSCYHGKVVPTEAGWRYILSGLASLAMGMQNATITKISGNVVRTTHVTGVVTDLAIEGVQFLLWWRDKIASRWAQRAGRLAQVTRRNPTFLRLLLLASIFGSFLLGATAGALIHARLPLYAMVPPVLFLVWIIFVDWTQPIADIRELDLLSDPEFKGNEIVKAMLPPELGLYRFSCHHTTDQHRAPNLQLWVDRLPPSWRVVILAVSPLTQFDANAVLDLEAAVTKLHANGRKLIICGLTPMQVRSLDALGVARMMDVSNICPDLEFAIARGMAIVHDMKASRLGGLLPATVAAAPVPVVAGPP